MLTTTPETNRSMKLREYINTMRTTPMRRIGTAVLAVVAMFATLLGTVSQAEAQGANLALNQPTTQSSEWVNNPGPASVAVDGNTNGLYQNGSVTHTANEATPWWQVDLGASQSVGTVTLFNRTDCCSNRLTNFYVFVSETDPVSYTHLTLPTICSV